MNDLKIKYEGMKSLAKQMMKVGNLAEYFRILNEANKLQLSLVSTNRK